MASRAAAGTSTDVRCVIPHIYDTYNELGVPHRAQSQSAWYGVNECVHSCGTGPCQVVLSVGLASQDP